VNKFHVCDRYVCNERVDTTEEVVCRLTGRVLDMILMYASDRVSSDKPIETEESHMFVSDVRRRRKSEHADAQRLAKINEILDNLIWSQERRRIENKERAACIARRVQDIRAMRRCGRKQPARPVTEEDKQEPPIPQVRVETPVTQIAALFGSGMDMYDDVQVQAVEDVDAQLAKKAVEDVDAQLAKKAVEDVDAQLAKKAVEDVDAQLAKKGGVAPPADAAMQETNMSIRTHLAEACDMIWTEVSRRRHASERTGGPQLRTIVSSYLYNVAVPKPKPKLRRTLSDDLIAYLRRHLPRESVRMQLDPTLTAKALNHAMDDILESL